MKVLHVAQSVKGGVATYLSEILNDQVSRYGKGNVVAVVPKGGRDDIELSDDIQCVEFSDVSRNFSSLYRAAIEVLRVIDEFSPDIIHLHSSFAGLLRFPLFFKNKYKIVYCAHGWAFSQDIGRVKKFIYGLVEAFLFLGTNSCINISNNDSREARRFFISGARVSTITNGISDISDYSESQRLGIESDQDTRFVFIGRFDRQKGVDKLVRVFEKNSNKRAHLSLVGAPVVDSNNPFIINDNRIKTLGWLKRSEVVVSLANAHAIIIPSRWEGFGLIAIEAMRSGVAVVCSDVGELPSIVENGRTGYVFSSEEELLNIIETTSVRQFVKMGLVGRDVFLKKYLACYMNNKIAILYDSLLVDK